MSFNQAQRGPDMSSNLVGMSKYISSSNAASRSSVVMSAATISGDGAFESQGENYMDQLDEMKGAAFNRLKKAKNARSSVIMSASATDYSTELILSLRTDQLQLLRLITSMRKVMFQATLTNQRSH